MIASCSVNARGGCFTFCPRFKVTICDLERRRSSVSADERRNRKSAGNLRALRFTAWLRAFYPQRASGDREQEWKGSLSDPLD
jgi:hypothetical protein